jgi:small subunit ribosomal protein S1
MDGLIHVSELSWKHVDHPGQVVQVGDQVTVRVLDVDLDRERISLSLKATQADPWQEFANAHRVGELVYGRVTKLVPFGAFVQVGDGIEGLVHISEMAVHHVDQPDQVVTPGEELWVKIIDIDLARRRISLSIKQAAEGGEVAAEYREAFGEHAYDEHGNYIGAGYTAFEPESEAQAAWAGYLEEQANAQQASGGTGTPADDEATEAAAELVDEALISEATAVVEVAAAEEAVAAAEAALAEEATLDDEIAELGVDAVEEAALEEDAAAETPAAAPPATAKSKEADDDGPAAPPAK